MVVGTSAAALAFATAWFLYLRAAFIIAVIRSILLWTLQ